MVTSELPPDAGGSSLSGLSLGALIHEEPWFNSGIGLGARIAEEPSLIVGFALGALAAAPVLFESLFLLMGTDPDIEDSASAGFAIGSIPDSEDRFGPVAEGFYLGARVQSDAGELSNARYRR